MHFAHSFARHLGPDYFVVIKRHALARQHLASAGFANVMKQRCQTRDAKIAGHFFTHVLHHGKRVRQYVFMAMNRVLFKRQRWQLGQKMRSQTCLDGKPQGHGDRVGHDHAIEFGANAFSRHDLQPIVHHANCRHQRIIRHHRQRGHEPCSPQHA